MWLNKPSDEVIAAMAGLLTDHSFNKVLSYLESESTAADKALRESSPELLMKLQGKSATLHDLVELIKDSNRIKQVRNRTNK